MIDFTKINLAALWAGKRGEKSPIRLVGIRGAQAGASAPNKLAVYDDVILVEIRGAAAKCPTCGAPGAAGASTVTQWSASLDPSWALVVHPINPDGAAQLRPGVHLMQKHLLHGKYPCLGQAENVHVNRLNVDGSVDHVANGDFGICIHSGGRGMDTGRFSAGCQIIQNDDGYFGNPRWNNFWVPIRDGMTAHKLKVVPYRLLDRASLPTP